MIYSNMRKIKIHKEKSKFLLFILRNLGKTELLTFIALLWTVFQPFEIHYLLIALYYTNKKL